MVSDVLNQWQYEDGIKKEFLYERIKSSSVIIDRNRLQIQSPMGIYFTIWWQLKNVGL